MFCSNCGTQLGADSKFCVHCGAPVAPATGGGMANPTVTAITTGTVGVPGTVQMHATPAQMLPAQMATEQAKEKAASAALTWGILSLAFALHGVFISFLGIIFGVISFKKADYFTYLNSGVLTGKAQVGRILGKIGFIVGIVLTAILTLCFFSGFIEGIQDVGTFSNGWAL